MNADLVIDIAVDWCDWYCMLAFLTFRQCAPLLSVAFCHNALAIALVNVNPLMARDALPSSNDCK